MGRTVLNAGQRIRTLIVDDSVVIRRLVANALEDDPEIEVVGAAANGAIALQKIPQVNPDVVTMDVEMPEMDGIEALRRIRKEYPNLIVIMFSTLTSRGASATMEALGLGASDYVTKPSHIGSIDRSVTSLRDDLIPKIKQFFLRQAMHRVKADVDSHAHSQAHAQSHAHPAPPVAAGPRSHHIGQRRILAIGVSTGGPTALAEIFPSFPADLRVPIVIVQHMPPMFTRLLAERLQQKSKLRVEEATDGMRLEPGKAIVAPGDYHLKIRRMQTEIVCTLNQDPPENSCRPAVDVLFRSVQDVYGGSTVAAILTGMGQDGLRGVEGLHATGAYVIAQDEASSVVWGMPGAVVKAGLADSVVPLQGMVPEMLRRLG